MSEKVRWGIAGTGTVAGNFASDFVHAPRAELVACCSRSQQTADSFGRQWNIEKTFGQYKDMLADPGVDVVYVAVPHHVHKQYCLQAFEAGKAVLCEKPFALNETEARDIVQAARSKNVFCMEAMWMRCMPLLHRVTERIKAGEIGDVTHIHAEFGYPTDFDPMSRFFDLNQAGGSLLDRGIYTIALAYHILGKPVSVTGEANIGKTGVDESSCYRLEFESGATADLCSTLTGYAANAAVIAGTQGVLTMHAPFYRPELISVKRGGGARKIVSALCDGNRSGKLAQKIERIVRPFLLRISGTQCERQPIAGHGYQYEIDEVSRCLSQRQTESSAVPHDDTLGILNVMDKLRAQWKLKYPQEI
ncbi:MAG: Gfo/Idh/MocA family oxidoreductase [Planctomycetales bacterium]|nr:Gfo/Idh/MocA family oxidoreductase [Planctomycetales bacterium]